MSPVMLSMQKGGVQANILHDSYQQYLLFTSQCLCPFLQVPNDPSRPDSQSQNAHSSSVTGSVTSQTQLQNSVATTVLLADTQGLSVEQNSVSASGTSMCPTIQVQSLLFCMLPLLQRCNESGKLRPAHVRPSNYCIGRAGYELQSQPAAAAASGVDLRQAGQSIASGNLQHCIRDSRHCISDSQHCPRDSQHCIRDSQHCIRDSQHCIFCLRMQHIRGLQ